MRFHGLYLAALVSVAVASPVSKPAPANIEERQLPSLVQFIPYCTGSGTLPTLPAPYNTLFVTAVGYVCQAAELQSGGLSSLTAPLSSLTGGLQGLSSLGSGGLKERRNTLPGTSPGQIATNLSAFCSALPSFYTFMFTPVCGENIATVAAQASAAANVAEGYQS